MAYAHVMGIRRRKAVNAALRYILLIILGALWMAPMLFVIFTAFKTPAELTMRRFVWLPGRWRFENFSKALGYAGYNWPLYFRNSLFVTAVSVASSGMKN